MESSVVREINAESSSLSGLEMSAGPDIKNAASAASMVQSDSKRPPLDGYGNDVSGLTRRPVIPTTGMRGGLGRTLLTAFLILTIVPLSLVGWYAVEQNRRNIQQEMERKLQAVAMLKIEELRQWFTQFETLFRFSTCQTALESYTSPGGASVSQEFSAESIDFVSWWENLHEQVADLRGVSFVDSKGAVVWTAGTCKVAELPSDRISFRTLPANPSLESYSDDGHSRASTSRDRSLASTVLFSLPRDGGTFIFCLQWDVVQPVTMADVATLAPTLASRSPETVASVGHIYLVKDGFLWPEGEVWEGEGVQVLNPQWLGSFNSASPDRDVAASASAATSSDPVSALYINHLGVPVIGAYAFIEELGVGILVEQEQSNMLTSSDRIATTLIVLTLAVALTTTIIAAVVIRQITRPVILLTESALAMAEGDLNQHLQVASQDEIGILTYVFNKMAAELNQLYAGLEAKVAERTKMLQRANYQIQQRAIQLKASQEVGHAITSMRDPDALLHRVVDLIRDRFLFASVGVYLVEPGGGEARLQAVGPLGASWPKIIQAGDGSVVEKTLRKGTLQVASEQTGEPLAWQRRTLTRIVVPLRMGERILGALAVLNAERELGGSSGGMYGEDHADDLMVLELLANQVAVALENAQAYERERQAARKLEEAEAFKSHFLANMSHELREPLNTIMGFTRLMLKGLDGPLTPAMTQDLDRIYDDSQHLLALINDILAISEIQAGLMELKIQPVDLQEVVDSVMPTASALVRGKDIDLVKTIAERLPLVRADPTRIRQVLIHLLTNAAKFTEVGEITIQIWHDEDLVYVSVSDTGVGIPPEDRERIFTKFATGVPSQSREGRLPGVGLGLALSKEFVELHGGQIWVKSEVGEGTTFTFSLPYYGEGVALNGHRGFSNHSDLSLRDVDGRTFGDKHS
jgi:signal transduction histidine kinase/HAMP domain-containing protein